MEQTSDSSASACFKTSYAEHLPYLGMDLIKSKICCLFPECIVLNKMLWLKALNSGKWQESQIPM